MKDQKRLIAIEIELGFLNVPARLRKLFPKKKGEIDFTINNNKKRLLYNPSKPARITGLTKFYRNMKATPTDIIEFEVIENKISLNLKKLNKDEKKNISITEEEAREIIDTGKLPAPVKGNIVEQRIAELILLYGQGQLNVYKPLADIEGIDLIVVKKGVFQPIFIQAKGRYNLRNNQIQIGIRERNFVAHHSFFVVVAYFNPKKIDLDDYLIFISSENFKEEANVINRGSNNAKYILTCPLDQGYNGRFAQYIIKKENLVNKIFEKFTEMKKYYN